MLSSTSSELVVMRKSAPVESDELPCPTTDSRKDLQHKHNINCSITSILYY